MPVDMVTYTAVVTLIVFLLFRIPGVWSGVDFTRGKTNGRTAGGAAAIVVGVVWLVIPVLAGPSHTWALGINWAEAFNTTLIPLGLILIVGGFLVALLPVPQKSIRFSNPGLRASK